MITDQACRARLRCTLLMLWASLAAASALSTAADRKEAFVGYVQKRGCRDSNGNCEDWAKSGECTKNPGFMKETCPVACNDCTPAELNVESFFGEVLVLVTQLGNMKVKLFYDRTPRTAALVMDMAHQAACKGCNFYRNEAIPMPEQKDGPPYGLVQGSFAGLLKTPPHEGGRVEMKRGHIAMIPGTREFFINLVDHPGWGDSMTVFGELEDLTVADSFAALPYHDSAHPQHGTVMRLTTTPVHFEPRFERIGGIEGAEL